MILQKPDLPVQLTVTSSKDVFCLQPFLHCQTWTVSGWCWFHFHSYSNSHPKFLKHLGSTMIKLSLPPSEAINLCAAGQREGSPSPLPRHSSLKGFVQENVTPSRLDLIGPTLAPSTHSYSLYISNENGVSVLCSATLNMFPLKKSASHKQHILQLQIMLQSN